MRKTNLSHLQKAANEVTKSASPEEKVKSLTKAFELFSKETTRLEVAYRELSDQFRQVKSDLEESNEQLHSKVVRLDYLTHYLHSILTHINQGILFVDLEGVVTTYNHAAEEILEHDHLDILFNSFWAYFEDSYFGFSIKQALMTKKSPPVSFVTITLPSGQERELEVQSKFILQEKSESVTDSAGNPIESIQGIIILLRDLTEIRRLQIQANRNDRMKELGEMAAMVAHEIRNPLGGIKGFATLLQRDLIETPQLQQMAGYIVEGTDNLNRLVSNVLNYARPVKPNFEAIDLVKLLEELLHHLQADSIVKSGIKISFKSSIKKIIVQADAQLLKSALLNMVVNSIQAMPDGGKITLGLEQHKDKCTIIVTDTGCGIPPEHIEKIFSPFFTTKQQGNGLGLSEVHKVILAHGGVIEVSSEVGKGSEFRIHLPFKPQRNEKNKKGN